MNYDYDDMGDREERFDLWNDKGEAWESRATEKPVIIENHIHMNGLWLSWSIYFQLCWSLYTSVRSSHQKIIADKRHSRKKKPSEVISSTDWIYKDIDCFEHQYRLDRSINRLSNSFQDNLYKTKSVHFVFIWQTVLFTMTCKRGYICMCIQCVENNSSPTSLIWSINIFNRNSFSTFFLYGK